MVVAEVLQNMRIGFVYLKYKPLPFLMMQELWIRVFVCGNGVTIDYRKNAIWRLNIDLVCGRSEMSHDLEKYKNIDVNRPKKIDVVFKNLWSDYVVCEKEDFLKAKEQYGKHQIYI